MLHYFQMHSKKYNSDFLMLWSTSIRKIGIRKEDIPLLKIIANLALSELLCVYWLARFYLKRTDTAMG